MSQQRISLVIPGGGPHELVESPTYTPCSGGSATSSSRKRRSLINIPSSLIPGRGKFHKFWPPGSRRSTAEGDFKNWNDSELSAVIRLAGVQMSALGNPANAMSPRTQPPCDEEWRQRPMEKNPVRMADCSGNVRQRPLEKNPVRMADCSGNVRHPPVETNPMRMAAYSDQVRQRPEEKNSARVSDYADNLSLQSHHASLRQYSSPPPTRKPLPGGLSPPLAAAPMHAPPPVPAPLRAPPPPPLIAELPADEGFTVDFGRLDAVPSRPPPPSTSVTRTTGLRRAKTPVRKVGQLERAARQKRMSAAAGVNRMSSVSTIARSYRDLVELPEEPDVPEVPPIDPKYLPQQSAAAAAAAAAATPRKYDPAEYRRSLLFTPSPVSDNSTLVSPVQEPAEAHYKTFRWPSPMTPPMEATRPEDEQSIGPNPAALRFQVGVDLLTRELSSAIASNNATQSSPSGGTSSGLQVWLMIEAYERLRDQLAASGTQNEDVKLAIDAWLEALHTIHQNLVDEADRSDSEYEDDDVVSLIDEA
ncbi:restless-like transposase [Purpureocillium lavendulum]|uniref:Restless-like transposase n=1 Tax=Purpureocillium lavendulum TaxID=1247861 RepID=A0AB34FJT6_9HYPO|nr:restless-like transposase [Purpureocillium lavendulum]